MSYISTVTAFETPGARLQSGVVRPVGPRAPAGGVLEAVGGALTGAVEAVVFLVVMGGLSVTFCTLVAGPF